MSVRIAKYIADSGIASRRAAEDMISAGRISVNGVVIDTPVFFVNNDDVFALDGRTITLRTETELYAFGKILLICILK